MAIRTITAPGVEIREIDKSGYTTVPTGTAVYLKGFTGKGEPYRPMEITTRSAYEQIYEKSQRLVYSICRGVLQNDEDAFDAMQDTYLTVYKKIGSLEDNKTFVSWLKRIATTKSLDLYRYNDIENW